MANFGPNEYTSPGPDNLWGGTQISPVVAGPWKVKQDAVNKVYLRGTVLGLVSKEPDTPATEDDPAVTGDPLPPEDHILVPVDKTATDGSQDVFCILADDIDVSEGDYDTAPFYETGEFNEHALIFISGDDAADHRLSARNRSIFFRINVPAN